MTCKLEFLGKLSSKNSLENNLLTVYQNGLNKKHHFFNGFQKKEGG